MTVRKPLGINVWEASVLRMRKLYSEGHRVVVSFSAGKDSGVCLEVCIEAARQERKLPVEVVMRDEEIMFPGTFEYAERVMRRPEVSFRWLVARQPIINIYNRASPYWWVFDERIPEEQWVRPLPEWAEIIPDPNIEAITDPNYYVPSPGKNLICVTGLRGSESVVRKYSIFSAGGFLTKPTRLGFRRARPIYDWGDGDVWLAHKKFGWDYNAAYDVMHRMGVSRNSLRIAPPTMSAEGVGLLAKAAQAWPQWFQRVSDRVPGARVAALYGRRAITARRRLGETWQEAFERECIDKAPGWIAERSIQIRDRLLRAHARHSATPLPESVHCQSCVGSLGSWRQLARAMYNGDPFCTRISGLLPYVEPEFFREGAGTWHGSPAFA